MNIIFSMTSLDNLLFQYILFLDRYVIDTLRLFNDNPLILFKNHLKLRSWPNLFGLTFKGNQTDFCM